MFVFGLGNPLLDIVVDVSNEFLKTRTLNRGSAYLYDPAVHGQDFFDEVIKLPKASFAAGSATLNTLRVCQALLSTVLNLTDKVGYTGCVGNDQQGELLEQLCSKEGIAVDFIKSDRNSTGRCAVCINGNDRTMITELGASNDFKIDMFKSWDKLASAKVVYSAGFHLTVCPELMECLARYCGETQDNKIFLSCLCAEFIPQFYMEPLIRVLVNTDVLFGNKQEFLAFSIGKAAEILGPYSPDLPKGYESFTSSLSKKNSKTSLEQTSLEQTSLEPLEMILRFVANIPFKSGGHKRTTRLVFCTNGSESTYICTTGGNIIKITPPQIAAEDIVDANGAGDAFIAGLIFAYCYLDYKKLPSDIEGLSKLAKVGHYAAQHIIKHSGCSFNFEGERELILKTME